MSIMLLVEDNSHERENAKKVLAAAGLKVAVATNLQDACRILEQLGEKVAGIITDLHFPERPDQPDAEKPCGLAVVAQAVRRGIPVAVCSDINHHFADYVKVVIEVLAQSHPKGSIPFVMDSKDWSRAVSELTKHL